MKIIHTILPPLLACGVISAQGTWNLTERNGLAYIGYDWDAKSEGAPSIESLVKILATRNKNIPLESATFSSYFNNDPTIQGELLKELRSNYTKLLADALKSSGNIHNPKVLPLRSKFSECLLKTPTLSKINKVLFVHGFSVTRVEFEKFWIDKEQQTQTFHAIIWITIEPQVDANEKAEQGADGEAEEAP